MSHEDDKFNHSRRLYLDQTAIKKQVKIARASFGPDHKNVTTETNRLNKRHAMDCGQPQCNMCGNRRRTEGMTAQEKRAVQNIEVPSNKHSNGLPPDGRDW